MKDSCAKIAGWLEPYLDGELSPGKAELVERHLPICQHCQQELKDLKALTAGLRGAVVDPEGEARLKGLWPAIAEGVEKGSLLRGWADELMAWLRLHLRPALGLAAAALLIIGALMVYRPGLQGPVTPSEVDILSLESSGPVLVFNPPQSQVTVIWLFY